MRGSSWAVLLGLPIVAMIVVAAFVLQVGWRLIVALSSARSK